MLLEDRDTASPEETVTPLNGMGTLSVGNMRYVMTASEVFKPGSDDAISKKSNWSEAISGSKVSFTKEYTKEKYDSSVLLKMLKETGNLFASRDMVENEIKNTELGLVSVDANGIRYSNSETNEIEWEIEFLNDKEYEKAQMIMDWVFQNNISSEFIM